MKVAGTSKRFRMLGVNSTCQTQFGGPFVSPRSMLSELKSCSCAGTSGKDRLLHRSGHASKYQNAGCPLVFTCKPTLKKARSNTCYVVTLVVTLFGGTCLKTRGTTHLRENALSEVLFLPVEGKYPQMVERPNQVLITDPHDRKSGAKVLPRWWTSCLFFLSRWINYRKVHFVLGCFQI